MQHYWKRGKVTPRALRRIKNGLGVKWLFIHGLDAHTFTPRGNLKRTPAMFYWEVGGNRGTLGEPAKLCGAKIHSNLVN